MDRHSLVGIKHSHALRVLEPIAQQDSRQHSIGLLGTVGGDKSVSG